jgi:chromosome segregation ATPase
VADLVKQLADLKAQLAAAEEEAEAGASEAVKATRARERLERESREKQAMLQTALETKIKENAALQETLSNMESAHSRDLESFVGRLNEREGEVSRLRDEAKAAGEMMEALKSQLEEAKRKADEETRKAVERATDKARKEAKEKGVDEAVVAEWRTKVDAAQVGGARRRARFPTPNVNWPASACNHWCNPVPHPRPPRRVP